MIFTIVNNECRQSKVTGRTYYWFKLMDDYEHIHYAAIGSLKLLEEFHKKNGIYWSDKEPIASDYIGFIISGNLEWTQYANRQIKVVRIV